MQLQEGQRLMGYLNVDDQLAFHRKTVAAGNAAMGLWVRAGSWASGQQTDGFIPEDIAKALGKPREVAALLNAGLWERAITGYVMHDYDDHNITAEQHRALSEKRAAAGRKGGLRRPGLSAIKGEANA
jgi:hypothetical protein